MPHASSRIFLKRNLPRASLIISCEPHESDPRRLRCFSHTAVVGVKAIAIRATQLYLAGRPLQTGLRIAIILGGKAWLRAQQGKPKFQVS
jgi:hypothetical protein